jgi:outer membrane PBP1 activator LpoA protein
MVRGQEASILWRTTARINGSRPSRRAWLGAFASAVLLAGCTTGISVGDLMPGSSPSTPAAPANSIGEGKVKVGLILPLSGSGNAAVAATSMRNSAEMALAEFNSPDIQLLVKDDGGTAQGAQQAAQQVLDEGAEIILGPLFALTVGPVGQLARSRNVPVIAFSTDANVAARGVYLLSFLPETDVDRIIGYAASQGRRSFAALVPDNAYGSVVEAAFKQQVARRGGRVIALERYPLDKAQMVAPVRNVAASASKGADADRGAESGLERHRPQARADPRHRLVGGRADFLQLAARRRLVRRARFHGLPQLLRPLSHPLRSGSRAHRLARL